MLKILNHASNRCSNNNGGDINWVSLCSTEIFSEQLGDGLVGLIYFEVVGVCNILLYVGAI